MNITLKHLIMAARPRTLTAGLSPVLLGLAVAVNYGPAWGIAVLTLICCLLLQTAANLANDYFDAQSGVDTPDRLGPVRVTQNGLLSPESVRNAFLVCFGIALLLGIPLVYRGGTVIVCIGLLSIIGAYLYTGGPWPLSHHGMGEVLAFVFFGPVAVCGTFYLQTLSFSWEALVVSFGPGFLAALLMSVNNLRDITTDKKAEKYTVPVRLGEQKARSFSMVLFIATLSIPVICFLFHMGNYFLLVVPFSGILYRKSWHLIRHAPIDASFNNILADTGKLFLVYSILFCAGIVK